MVGNDIDQLQGKKETNRDIHLRSSTDRKSRAPPAVRALSCEDLVRETRPQVHLKLLPCLEMTCRRDISTNTPTNCALRIPDRPKLFKSLGTLNRRLVDAPSRKDIVGGAIALDGAFLCRMGGGVVAAI